MQNRLISFIAGQPLGYRSSWPLFALTHHALGWCAEQCYPGKFYTDYAILDDNIVIADGAVAATYKEAVSKLKVRISIPKSLVSNTGAAEFAKRFFVKGLEKDLSHVLAKAVLNAYHPWGRFAIAHRYQITRFATFCRLGVAGYKNLSGDPHKNRNHDSILWRHLEASDYYLFYG